MDAGLLAQRLQQRDRPRQVPLLGELDRLGHLGRRRTEGRLAGLGGFGGFGGLGGFGLRGGPRMGERREERQGGEGLEMWGRIGPKSLPLRIPRCYADSCSLRWPCSPSPPRRRRSPPPARRRRPPPCATLASPSSRTSSPAQAAETFRQLAQLDAGRSAPLRQPRRRGPAPAEERRGAELRSLRPSPRRRAGPTCWPSRGTSCSGAARTRRRSPPTARPRRRRRTGSTSSTPSTARPRQCTGPEAEAALAEALQALPAAAAGEPRRPGPGGAAGDRGGRPGGGHPGVPAGARAARPAPPVRRRRPAPVLAALESGDVAAARVPALRLENVLKPTPAYQREPARS